MTHKIASIVLDFRLRQALSLDDMALVVDPIKKTLPCGLEQILSKQGPNNKSHTICLESHKDQDVFVLIRLYHGDSGKPGLLTITIEGESLRCAHEEELDERLRGSLAALIEPTNFVSMPLIKRCLQTTPYLRTSDDRVVEYGFQEVLFRQRSPHQLVEIVETTDFGRILILDGLVNLAENDTEPYTHTLMNLPNEDYKDKEILILGGGDGGLIKELLDLEEKPAFVTMIDIDEIVMEACNQFMPKVCGPYLQKANREGQRHKVITGDAIAFMKEALASGRKFDYIFGDLTDTPVSKTPRHNDLWNFFREILTDGLSLLKPNTGKYMTHCNGKNVPESVGEYEEVLRTILNGKCSFERSERFVPSFMETWIFYRIRRHED